MNVSAGINRPAQTPQCNSGGREMPTAGTLARRRNPYLGMGGFGVDKSLSEETARTVDAEVARIIAESHEQAKTLLRRHREQLDDLVKALLARETLDEQQILEVTGLSRAPERETRRVAAASSQ